MRGSRRALLYHLPAITFLIALTIMLFRKPLFGHLRFIGNSDRWNHYLSFATFHAANAAQGEFSAWCEFLFMGFDTLALPFSFWTPLFLLPPAFGTADVVRVFGYVTPALLLLAMVTAYLVIVGVCADRLAAVVGALVFALSIFSLLKLSQNDNTYLVLVLTPLLFHLVRSATRTNLVSRVVWLTLLTALCLYVAFLQEFSYVTLLLVTYAAYRQRQGESAPLTAIALGLLLGLVLAAPRLAALVDNMVRSTRGTPDVVEYVSPVLFLRFLNGDIFGRSWREASQAHAINLSEGNLMFASAFASLLLLLVILRRRYALTITVSGEARTIHYGFFIAFIVGVMLIIHIQPLYNLFGLLYGGVSFLHTRLDAAALLPIGLVSALYLTRAAAWRFSRRRMLAVAGLAGTIVVLGFVDFSNMHKPFARLPGLSERVVFVPEALRWAVLAAAFLVLALGHRWRVLDGGTYRTTLAVVIIVQATLAADHFLTGPQTRTYAMPFERHDSVLANRDEFQPPTAAQLAEIQQQLDNENYRSILVCPTATTPVDCSTAIGMVWRIRLLDGYLSSLLKRYAALPWPPSVPGMRSIRFHELPRDWALLSLLNVRQAIVVTPPLYMNRDFQVARDLVVVSNPSPYIYPRAYFATEVRALTHAEAVKATRDQFGDGHVLGEKHPIDYVEGPVLGPFEASGDIRWRFSGDIAVLSFSATSRKRFLVVNESYDQRWQAFGEGRRLPVYQTNLVMRGIVIPAGAREVTLRFRSVLDDTLAYLGVVLPLGGLAAGLVWYRRLRAPRRIPEDPRCPLCVP